MKYLNSYRSGIVIGVLLFLIVLFFKIEHKWIQSIKYDNYRYLFLVCISITIVHLLTLYNTYLYKTDLKLSMLKYKLDKAKQSEKVVLVRFAWTERCFTASQVLSGIIIILAWVIFYFEHDLYDDRHFVSPLLDFLTVIIFILFFIGDGLMAGIKRELVDQLKSSQSSSTELEGAILDQRYVEKQRALISFPGLVVMIIIFFSSFVFAFYPHSSYEIKNPATNGIFPEGFSYGASVLHLLFTQLTFNYLESRYKEGLE